jgi:DNA-binding MarR family transcriptional regulator
MRDKEAEFTTLKERTRASAGNLSVQINKLREAGYIEVKKDFKDNYPHTICKITSSGSRAFDQYVKCLQSYLSVNGKKA